jgi:opacity protein-like surface antigen
MEDRVVKRTIIVFAGLFALMASAYGSERLIGQNWVTGKMGYMDFPSDFDPIDSGWLFSARGNLNVMDQLDVQPRLEYAWADDGGVEISFTTIGAEAIYFFKPNAKVNPYAKGGLAMIWTDVQAGGNSADDSNLGWGGGGGAEFTMGDKMVMQLGGDLFVVDGDDSVRADARFAYAFSPKILGDLSLNYDFDSEITTLSLGMTYRLQGVRKR